jgi:MarR family transcriptional regulator for hemolysin
LSNEINSKGNYMTVSADECARDVLEVVPLIMRAIRREMRSHRTDLSVPQFRTLAFIRNHEGTSLSAVAENIGLTLPSMSKLVDGLVQRQLVIRQTAVHDRRRITLALTEAGLATMRAARESTLGVLADQFAVFSEVERQTIRQAIALLRPGFTPGSDD